MPRNGSGVASKPAGTTFVPNTTIESAKVNSVVDDIYALMNDALPITAGGTGATSASSARTGLEVDKKVVYAAKTGAYTAVAADNNAVHRFTDVGTVTLTAAATLAANWHYIVIADGGARTIDPDGSETINGAATLVIADGDSAFIICTGSAFEAVVIPTATAVTLAGTQTLSNKTLTSPVINTPSGELLRGHINGLTLSNNVTDATNDIDIAAGSAGSDGTTPALMVLASALTKRLDAAWAVGTNQGGLDTGSIANTTYHVWLIQRSDTGVVDVLFSTSATSPTMPTNYDRKRRIGSIIRSAAAILPFTQRDNEFRLLTPVNNVNANAPGTSAVTRTLTVPTGIVVDAKFRFVLKNSSVTTFSIVLFTALTDADTAPDTTIGNYHAQSANASGFTRAVAGDLTIPTNTSAQIRSRNGVLGDSNVTLEVATYGWIDDRGRSL